MKKSDIYKIALVATISKIVMDNDLDPDKVYETVYEIAERINLEIYSENKEITDLYGGMSNGETI